MPLDTPITLADDAISPWPLASPPADPLPDMPTAALAALSEGLDFLLANRPGHALTAYNTASHLFDLMDAPEEWRELARDGAAEAYRKLGMTV